MKRPWRRPCRVNSRFKRLSATRFVCLAMSMRRYEFACRIGHNTCSDSPTQRAGRIEASPSWFRNILSYLHKAAALQGEKNALPCNEYFRDAVLGNTVIHTWKRRFSRIYARLSTPRYTKLPTLRSSAINAWYVRWRLSLWFYRHSLSPNSCRSGASWRTSCSNPLSNNTILLILMSSFYTIFTQNVGCKIKLHRKKSIEEESVK